jgi:hypothetical protein
MEMRINRFSEIAIAKNRRKIRAANINQVVVCNFFGVQGLNGVVNGRP